MGNLGLVEGFQDVVDKIKEIGEGSYKSVKFDSELQNYVSLEAFEQMYE